MRDIHIYGTHLPCGEGPEPGVVNIRPAPAAARRRYILGMGGGILTMRRRPIRRGSYARVLDNSYPHTISKTLTARTRHTTPCGLPESRETKNGKWG